MREATDAVWDCNRDNLSPPVLAKNKGTAVFRLVPLQGEVSGSVSRIQSHTASERTVQGTQSSLCGKKIPLQHQTQTMINRQMQLLNLISLIGRCNQGKIRNRSALSPVLSGQ